jgi:hypothetical protein
MSNPFIPTPLDDWELRMWYVNRELEEQNLFEYLQNIMETPEGNKIIGSHNFVVIGQGGSGKTTLLNYIKNKCMPSFTEGCADHIPIAISTTSTQDLRSLLTEIITKYLGMKPNPTPEEKEFFNQIKTPTKSKNIPLSTLENFFTYEFNINSKDNPIVLIDNAHFLIKDRFFKGFITGKGFQSRFYIGLFMTPKSYYDLMSNDIDRVLDRFPKKIIIGKLSPDQTKAMVKKRLEFVNVQIDKFLSNSQLDMIYNSLNGTPRPMIFAFRNLYEVYKQKNIIEDRDVAMALIDVRLETLDYAGLDGDIKLLLRVFMNNKGLATIKDLQDVNLPKATLYLKLNTMEKDGLISKMHNEETGEIIRGKWQLDQNMASVIMFGGNGELVKPYEEQE